MRELSTQEPRCSTGGMPIASQTSRRPGPAGSIDLGGQEAGLGRRRSRAQPVDDDEHVVLDQLAAIIVTCAESCVTRGLLQPTTPASAADAAGDDRVVERPERAAVHAALHVVDVLVARSRRSAARGSRGCGPRRRGSGSCRSPRGRSRGRSRGRGARRTRCARARDLAPSGEVVMSLVWKCFASGAERLHDALHVDDHRVDHAGEHGQLLVEEVAGRRDALAHQDLVGGAADAGEVDARGALRLRVRRSSRARATRRRSSPRAAARGRGRRC